MAVDGISGSGSSNSSITGTRAGIADNFDTFLSLLTAQLKNQNPLDPLDTNAFTQQLVQFSSVEQQLKTNDFLATLVQANTNAVQTNAVAYIGKTVAADGVRSELVNGKAVWNFSLEDAANVTVTIKDKTGATVYSETGNLQAGAGQFNWDGKTSTGSKASTTASATPPATSSCRWRRNACAIACATATPWPASAATSSPSCWSTPPGPRAGPSCWTGSRPP